MMAPVVYQSLVEAGMPKELAQLITVSSAAVVGNAAGGPAGSAAATSEAANNGVLAAPLILDGVLAAGVVGARACVMSAACMNVVKLAGAAAVAKVVAVASTPNDTGAPGYAATTSAPNHTGNQSAAPDYAGAGTTTPNNGPATGSTTTTPAQQPGATDLLTWAVPSGDKDASTPTGQRGSPIEVNPGSNAPTTIGGREYSGHALDRMQGRGVPPSAVEDAIQNGARLPGNSPGTFVHAGANGVIVVTGNGGRVITVISR